MEASEQNKATAPKIRVGVWRRIGKYAMRYPGMVYLIIAVMLGTALMDIFYPLFQGYAIDNFILMETVDGLPQFGLGYFAACLFQAVCVALFVYFAGKLEMNISYDIRKDGFDKLQRLSIAFFDKTSVGYLLARMISDVGRLSELIAWAIVDVAWAVAFLIGAIVSMFFLSPQLALITLAVIPVFVAISVVFQKRILKWQRRVRKTNSRITSAFNENMLGAVTTKTLVREQKNLEEFEQLTGEMRYASRRSSVLSAFFMSIVMIIGTTGTAAALYFGLGLVSVGGISLGTLSIFISYTMMMFEPVQSIARILAEMQTAQASAERVITLLDTPLDIVERPEVVETFGDIFEPRQENWPPLEGKIEFKHVDFSYIPDEPILTDFSLAIEKGETVAIVGETGAGKSTIVNLICRFYEPTGGTIEIDGADYRARSQLWLEKNLGYVMQVPHLFSGSVADNIKFGRCDASDEEMIRAAKMVNAHSFIEKLPHGYDTQVGEEGATLSTGQKQLISLARVLLVDPRIFVLDEATSSIDTEIEALIQDAINTALKDRTSIVIAHRLSTIRGADRILVLRAGEIVEQGNHDELIAQKGAYFRLYTNQFHAEQQDRIIGGEEAVEI